MKTALSISDLHKTYRRRGLLSSRAGVAALRGVSLEIELGEVVGLIGARNGKAIEQPLIA